MDSALWDQPVSDFGLSGCAQSCPGGIWGHTAPSANIQTAGSLQVLQVWMLVGLSIMDAGLWDWQSPGGLAHSFLIFSVGTWVIKVDMPIWGP